MKEPKLILSGVAVMDTFKSFAASAKWVGFGSFGIWMDFPAQLIPDATTAVIGVPREEPGRTKCLKACGILQARYGRLLLRYREDFHAKYCLFRMARSKWVMLGSSNLTSSPSIETSLMVKDEHLFDSIAKRHEKWFLHGYEVPKYNSVRLEKSILAGLSSQVVEGL